MKAAMIPCSTPPCHSQDWKKILSEAVTEPAELLKRLKLNGQQVGMGQATELFQLRVPHTFIDKMQPGDPDDPLFLQIWPRDQEFEQHPGYSLDPLSENQLNPTPGLLHKYNKRVLTIAAASCAINCRYCFRRHFPYQQQSYGSSGWQHWIHYLTANPEISEVILSGGEPLLNNDQQLEELVQKLSQLPQITRLRIHTRMPVAIPQRITTKMKQLAKNSPFKWILVLHINHPNEICSTLKETLADCHQHNILLLNQSVLLKDINNDADTLEALSEKLFAANILPYYLHCLDKVTATHHFAISDQEAQRIYQHLLTQLPGFLVPKLVREIAGERSKTLMVS